MLVNFKVGHIMLINNFRNPVRMSYTTNNKEMLPHSCYMIQKATMEKITKYNDLKIGADVPLKLRYVVNNFHVKLRPISRYY